MSRLLIFDLDGTIVDSRDSILASIAFALKQLGLAHLPLDQKRAVQLDLASSLKLAAAAGSYSLKDSEIQEFIRLYRKHHSSDPSATMTLYPGAKETLERLQESYELAIATTKHSAQAEHVLESLGVRMHFDFVQGTDPGMRYKPAPDILQAVLRRLEREAEEALYIGDSAHDMEAAHAAGMKAVGAAYGFSDEAALREARAHHLLFQFSEIEDALVSRLGGRASVTHPAFRRRPSPERKRSAWTAAQLAMHSSVASRD